MRNGLAIFLYTQFQEISSRQLYNFRRAHFSSLNIFELASMILSLQQFREEYNQHEELYKAEEKQP